MRSGGDAASAKRLRNELQGVDSIPRLFSWTFRHAVLKLAADDLASLLRLDIGDLTGLSWLSDTTVKELRAFFEDLAEREATRRHRFKQPERERLIAILQRNGAPDAPRTMFVVAYLLDEEFFGRATAADLEHSGVALVPARFLDEIKNSPPPIGQMTPVAACRRWMRTFWFVGDSRHLDAFGAVPRPDPRRLPSMLRQRLQSALDEDQLSLALVSYRRHQSSEFAFGKARDGCFAITGLTSMRPTGLVERMLDELSRAKVHIALLPEIAFDAAELDALKLHLAGRGRRFPCAVVVGIAHRAGGIGHTNETVVLDGTGAELLRHEKLEPFLEPTHGLEDIVPRSSTTYSYLDTPVGRIIVNICRDVRSDLPMFLNRILGASVLLVPAYSKRLDFAMEEARLLGARQGCITLSVNPPSSEIEHLMRAYAPIKGAESELKRDQEHQPVGDAVVQVIRVGRAARTGSLRADNPIIL